MTAEQRLSADRASRDAAWHAFNMRLERIRADVEARGIGSRLAGSVAEEVSGAVDVGLDVARERKGVVAGALAMVVFWIFRQPLIAAAVSVLKPGSGQADEGTEDESDD